MSASLCLADADVLIDGAKYGFLQPLLRTHTIGVASTAFAEVKFYREANGDMHAIDLQPVVTAGALTVVYGTAAELQSVYARGVSTRLGVGELEALSLVISRAFAFCTADQLAVKTMLNLSFYERWIALEELLACCAPPQTVPDAKYLRSTVESRVRRTK